MPVRRTLLASGQCQCHPFSTTMCIQSTKSTIHISVVVFFLLLFSRWCAFLKLFRFYFIRTLGTRVFDMKPSNEPYLNLIRLLCCFVDFPFKMLIVKTIGKNWKSTLFLQNTMQCVSMCRRYSFDLEILHVWFYINEKCFRCV